MTDQAFMEIFAPHLDEDENMLWASNGQKKKTAGQALVVFLAGTSMFALMVYVFGKHSLSLFQMQGLSPTFLLFFILTVLAVFSILYIFTFKFSNDKALEFYAITNKRILIIAEDGSTRKSVSGRIFHSLDFSLKGGLSYIELIAGTDEAAALYLSLIGVQNGVVAEKLFRQHFMIRTESHHE